VSENASPFKGWAIIELMGHRRLAGYVCERELASVVDAECVDDDDDEPFV